MIGAAAQTDWYCLSETCNSQELDTCVAYILLCVDTQSEHNANLLEANLADLFANQTLQILEVLIYSGKDRTTGCKSFVFGATNTSQHGKLPAKCLDQ